MDSGDSARDDATLGSPPTFSGWRERLRIVSNPVALRGLVMILSGAVLLLAPEVTTYLVLTVVVVLIGGAGINDLVYSATGRRWVRPRIKRPTAAFRGLLGLALAALLVFLAAAGDATLTLTLVTGLAGLYIGVRGVLRILGALSRRRKESRAEAIATGAILAGLGVLGFLVPESLLHALILLVATLSVILGLLLLGWSLRWSHGATSLDPASASIGEVVWDWIRLSDVGRSDRAALSETLYFDPPERATKLATWWVMLVLSVAIATFAVLVDSTAVVIGAMLVAPLMTPIVGLAGALVNGWQRRATASAVLVAAGAVAAILVSFALARWAPVAITFDSNSQITSRVTPTTIDMLIALAAGAAGAFATVNKRVSSSIAGVAIAVALVPPLAVVGICLSGGRTANAMGALLLFLTNFVAIVIAASLVFVLTGFARPFALRERRRQLLLTGAPFVTLAIAILAPLMLTSEGILASETETRDASRVVQSWLGDESDFIVVSVQVDGSDVAVAISGEGTPPSVEDLALQMRDELGGPRVVTLRVSPVDVSTATSPPR